MKKILILLSILAFYSTAKAQLLSFGLRGGISSSQIKIDDTETWKVDKNESEFGFHAGLFGRVQAPVIGLYVQPELLFSSTGGKVTMADGAGSVADQIINYDFNRIDIPVLVGWKFGIFRINAGPTFNVITKAQQKINGEDIVNIKDQYKNSTVGYQAGVGLDISKLLLDLKYEGSLSKFGDSINFPGIGDFATDQRSNQLILSLGIKF